MNKDFMCTYNGADMKIFANSAVIKERPKVYVISRYAGDIEKNRQNAIEYCRYVIKRQRIPIASHLLYPQILDDSDPEQRKLGLIFGHALLAVCSEAWVFGTQHSPGMEAEIREARRLGIYVRFFNERMEELREHD